MGKKTKIFYWIIRSILILIILSSIVGLILKFNQPENRDHFIFVIFNTFMLIIYTFIPNYLFKKKLIIPNIILNIYLIMVTSAVLLGEISGFYKTVKHFDSLLHFSTPSIIGLLGYSLINLLNSNKTIDNLNPLFTALFVFCFIGTVGVMWEVIEFAIDSITGSNMQRYINDAAKEPFVGQRALLDTMKDYILNSLGALITSVVIYFDLKHSKYLAKNATVKICNSKKVFAKKNHVAVKKNADADIIAENNIDINLKLKENAKDV